MSIEKAGIGIVIAAYNSEQFIERAMSSVLAQTSNDWRLVVVDDGSTDKTFEVAKTFARKDERIKVITQRNRGTGCARDRGISELDTRWVCYLDADDELLPDFCSCMIALAEGNPGYILYGCNIEYRTPLKTYNAWHYRAPKEISFEEWMSRGGVSSPGSLITKENYDQLGGYKGKQYYVEDLYLMIRAMLSGTALVSPKPLYVYYKGIETQKTADEHRRWEACAEVVRDVLEEENLSKEQEEILLEREEMYLEKVKKTEVSADHLGKSSSGPFDRVGRAVSHLKSFARKIASKGRGL